MAVKATLWLLSSALTAIPVCRTVHRSGEGYNPNTLPDAEKKPGTPLTQNPGHFRIQSPLPIFQDPLHDQKVIMFKFQLPLFGKKLPMYEFQSPLYEKRNRCLVFRSLCTNQNEPYVNFSCPCRKKRSPCSVSRNPYSKKIATASLGRTLQTWRMTKRSCDMTFWS